MRNKHLYRFQFNGTHGQYFDNLLIVKGKEWNDEKDRDVPVCECVIEKMNSSNAEWPMTKLSFKM